MFERRRFNRYSVKEGSLVILNGSKCVAGEIIDIGVGGISIRFSEAAGLNISSSLISQLIFKTVRIQADFPIVVVSNTEEDGENEEVNEEEKDMSRRIGLQFGSLSDQQTSILDRFIIHISKQAI